MKIECTLHKDYHYTFTGIDGLNYEVMSIIKNNIEKYTSVNKYNFLNDGEVMFTTTAEIPYMQMSMIVNSIPDIVKVEQDKQEKTFKGYVKDVRKHLKDWKPVNTVSKLKGIFDLANQINEHVSKVKEYIKSGSWDLAALTIDDNADMMKILDIMENGDYIKAYKEWRILDTAAREDYPDSTIRLLKDAMER
jgi:hypothetical protein